MALQDAWELAQQLANRKHGSQQAAISKFAEKAAPRSVGAIGRSHKIIGMAHSTGLLKLLFVRLLGLFGFLSRLVGSFGSVGWNAVWNLSPRGLVTSKPMTGQRASLAAAQKRD